jgi:hypothetical protein
MSVSFGDNLDTLAVYHYVHQIKNEYSLKFTFGLSGLGNRAHRLHRKN